MIRELKCVGGEGGVIVPAMFAFTWENDGFLQESCALTLVGEGVTRTFEQTGAERRILADLTCLKQGRYRYFAEAFGAAGAVRSEEKSLFVTDSDFGCAKWISDGRHYVELETSVGSPSVTLRKIFRADGTGERILKLCGVGFFTAYLNGERLGDGVLEPPFTAYDKRVIFRAYEVSALLKSGENILEVDLGDGWYNQTTEDTWGFCRAPWRDNVKLLACLTGKDGFVSDEDWEWSFNQVVANALRVGEKRDFTREREYRNVSVVNPAGGMLVFDAMPPVRECESRTPVAVRKEENRIYYDFGKNMSGYCELTFCGRRGARAFVTYSDRLTDGELDNTSNSMYIFNEGVRFQTDEVVLSGGRDVYHPKYVYHGYRYVCVETDGETEISEPIGYFVHTDLKRIGGFECSNPQLNALYEMSVQAILSNYVGIPTDCPHREKNGWTGDAQLSLETSVYTFDMSESYVKFLRDLADGQRPCGQIPAIAPTGGWGYNWGSGPAWDVAFFRLAYAEYYYYGRMDVLEAHYEPLNRYLTYLATYEDRDGLVANGLGDWCYPKKIEFEISPTRLTSSCYYLQMLNILAEISDVLGKGDGDDLRARAMRLQTAIRSAYAEETSLTGMAALSCFGIADKVDEIVRYLDRNGYQPHVGILGNKFLLDVLGQAGKAEEIFRYLSRTEYPSFGYWYNNGQTALCEDFELSKSLNHHMYSPVAEAMLKYLAGIVVGKGLTEFMLSPYVPKGESFVRAYLETPCGRLSVSAVRTGKGLEIETEIPYGVKAVLAATGETLPHGVTKRLLI